MTAAPARRAGRADRLRKSRTPEPRLAPVKRRLAPLELLSAEEVQRIGAQRLRAAGLLEHADIGPWLRPSVEAAE